MTEQTDSNSKWTEYDIIKMLDYLVDISVIFAGKVSQ